MNWTLRVGAMVLCVCAWRVSHTAAATYYVSAATGKASASCEAAKKSSTPQPTISAGIACLAPGDTLIIQAGTYAERLSDAIPSGRGSWETATTIQAAPGARVILRPPGNGDIVAFGQSKSYVIIKGVELDGSAMGNTHCSSGFRASNDRATYHHIRLAALHIHDMPTGNGIVVGLSGSHFEILNNRIHDLWGTGGAGCSRSGSTGAHGLYYRGSNGLIEGNEIFNTSGFGVQLYSFKQEPLRNNVIRNNTIHHVGKAGVVIGGSAENTEITNNIIHDVDQCFQYGGPQTQVHHNTCTDAKVWSREPRAGLDVKRNVFFHVGGEIPSENFRGDAQSAGAAGFGAAAVPPRTGETPRPEHFRPVQ